ncbi:MAG: hypothetical protein Phyf2KO_15800 [Phycisphaerales bacterium]
MASESMCWGIELGSSAIKALKLGVTSDGSVEVLDFAIIPHKKVLSTPDIDVDDAMRVAIGQLASQYDLESAPIAVSVPGNQAFARFAKLPPVEPKKVAGLVQYEAVQQIPFPLEEVEWDYQTFMSPDSPEIEVGIFAITKQRIERELSLFRDVGLSPDAVNVAPVSAYNAMAYDLQFTEKTPGTVIMDVGTNSTDLIIADAGRVWMRTFPIGGHHFTEALVEKFKLSYAKAERLKREAERSKHSRHVFQAMKGVFADLAQETQRSIGYHSSLHPDSELKRIIGVGSTFKLPGLRRFLKQQLQLDVYRMDEFKRLSLDGPRAGEFGAVTLEMSVAYGLALQGLGMPTIDANLMPVGVMRESMWNKKTKWFGIAAGLSLAASAAMFISWAMDNSAVSNNRKPITIQNVVNQANSLRNEADDAGVTGQVETDADAQALLSLPNGRELVAFVVADLGHLSAWSNQQVPQWQATRGGGPAEAFDVLSYTMTYKDGSAQEDPRGGRNRSGAQQVETPYPDKPKILVEFDLETNQPNPQPFILSTVLPWLQANADREDVPYVILSTESLNYESLGGGRNSRQPRNDRDTRSFNVLDDTGELPGEEFDTRSFNRSSTGGSAFNQNAVSGSIDELAPLPQPEEEDLGREPSRYKVRWTLAIVPPEERIGSNESIEDGGAE